MMFFWFFYKKKLFTGRKGSELLLHCVPTAAPFRYDEKARLFNPVLADLLSQVHLPTQGIKTTMYRLATSSFTLF